MNRKSDIEKTAKHGTILGGERAVKLLLIHKTGGGDRHGGQRGRSIGHYSEQLQNWLRGHSKSDLNCTKRSKTEVSRKRGDGEERGLGEGECLLYVKLKKGRRSQNCVCKRQNDLTLLVAVLLIQKKGPTRGEKENPEGRSFVVYSTALSRIRAPISQAVISQKGRGRKREGKKKSQKGLIHRKGGSDLEKACTHARAAKIIAPRARHILHFLLRAERSGKCRYKGEEDWCRVFENAAARKITLNTKKNGEGVEIVTGAVL